MYHRIADDPVDPWCIAVSPARFEEHLHVLHRTRRPLSLTHFFRDLNAGALAPNAVAVTFDDGYLDNLVSAKPRLVKADVPATVFLVTGFLDRPGEFWWDELARLILLENGPQTFELMVGGEPTHIDLGTESLPNQQGGVLAAPSARRRAALKAIYQVLRRLDDEERGLFMRSLRSIFATTDHHHGPSRALTSEEVKALAADGLMTIGAHTVTHPVLSGLEAVACRHEITDSKCACEALIGAPVPSFAYPYGNFNTQAREEVKAAGFTIACSVQHGPAFATSDPLALPRIHVHDWHGDEFERALRSASVYR
jgi:peptidoglycan/xylan/chitin deacetylase (PgdA/CDA1 family)